MKHIVDKFDFCRPINLSMIKKNIEKGLIRTTSEFQRDMMLMFTNAIMYNNKNQDVYQMAETMYNDSMAHLEVMIELLYRHWSTQEIER